MTETFTIWLHSLLVYELIMPCPAEGITTAPFWTPPPEHQYQCVRTPRFSTSRFWRESGDWHSMSQEEYQGIPSSPTLAPADKMETLTFVGNFDHPQPTSVRSCQRAPNRPVAVAPVRREESLTFVGNITHPSKVTQDQFISLLNSRENPVSEGATIHSVLSTQKTLLSPTILHSHGSRVMKHAHPSTIVNGQMQRSDVITPLLKEVGPLKFVGNFNLPAEVLHGQQNMKLKSAQVPDSLASSILSQRVSTTLSTTTAPTSLPPGACGGIPTHSKRSAVHCTREEYINMMEHHRHMASYYRELKSEHNPNMQGSVCPKELQGKTVSIHDRSWNEPMQEMCWEDATEGIVLPDDAVEKLNGIPGIWDLAIQMGFLTVCKADD